MVPGLASMVNSDGIPLQPPGQISHQGEQKIARQHRGSAAPEVDGLHPAVGDSQPLLQLGPQRSHVLLHAACPGVRTHRLRGEVAVGAP